MAKLFELPEDCLPFIETVKTAHEGRVQLAQKLYRVTGSASDLALLRKLMKQSLSS